jgi:hypothetical protein
MTDRPRPTGRTRLGLRHTATLLAAGAALILSASGFALARRSSDDAGVQRIPVLAYHGITTDAEVVRDDADARYFDVRLDEFDRQMAHLREARYQTITPDDYAAWVEGDDVTLPDKPILVTFDDGQTSAKLATPVLERYDFVAAMYVVSGFADGNYGGPHGEPGWYLTWDELKDMAASGHWVMQFHAGPQGHAYVNNPADPSCHRFYPCRFGQDDAAYEARVKADVAQGLGAIRSTFDLPDGWQGSTMAVPFDDDAASGTASVTDPWLARYFASQFPVVFVQDSYDGDHDNQRFRLEVHNSDDLDGVDAQLDSSRFAA